MDRVILRHLNAGEHLKGDHYGHAMRELMLPPLYTLVFDVDYESAREQALKLAGDFPDIEEVVSIALESSHGELFGQALPGAYQDETYTWLCSALAGLRIPPREITDHVVGRTCQSVHLIGPNDVIAYFVPTTAVAGQWGAPPMF